VTLFRTVIENKISLEFDNPPAGYDAYFRNSGTAYTQGVESSFSVRVLPPLRLFGSYTYTVARYDSKRGAPSDPNYEESDNILRTPDQTARLGLELAEKRYTGISIFASGRYTGKQYVERVMVVDGNTYIDHTDGYFLYDARVQWDIGYGEWTISAFFGVDNITNETQERIYSAEEEDSAAYIYAPLTGRYIYGGAKIGI
jgi:outer membrane receptor protein involved in Fe transport